MGRVFKGVPTGVLLATVLVLAGISQAAEPAVSKLTLISNVNIFDGKNERLLEDMHVLVKDNLIETISAEPLELIVTRPGKKAGSRGLLGGDGGESALRAGAMMSPE